MHGLHLMGGLVALGRTIAKVWRGAAMTQGRLSVELCAIYWHFLLLVWLVLLGLLTGWADDFVDICRQLLTSGGLRLHGSDPADKHLNIQHPSCRLPRHFRALV